MYNKYPPKVAVAYGSTSQMYLMTMLTHPDVADTSELYTRKIRVSNVFAAIEHVGFTHRVSNEDRLHLRQGVKLIDELLNGQNLFREERVTTQLVNAGYGFLAAAKALHYSKREEIDDCVQALEGFKGVLGAFIDTGSPPSKEELDSLLSFFTNFAQVLQSDIAGRRARRHELPGFL